MKIEALPKSRIIAEQQNLLKGIPSFGVGSLNSIPEKHKRVGIYVVCFDNATNVLSLKNLNQRLFLPGVTLGNIEGFGETLLPMRFYTICTTALKSLILRDLGRYVEESVVSVNRFYEVLQAYNSPSENLPLVIRCVFFYVVLRVAPKTSLATLSTEEGKLLWTPPPYSGKWLLRSQLFAVRKAKFIFGNRSRPDITPLRNEDHD